MPWLSVTDQLGNRLDLTRPPERIVSLVPSQTELLADLGLDHQVIGVTKFCVHPHHWRREKKVVGGSRKFDVDMIIDLNPDLIIGNKEENDRTAIETLQKQFSVWMSDISTFDQAIDMIRSVAAITNTADKGQALADEIIRSFQALAAPRHPIRTLYFMWYHPWMAAGGNTFINTMMRTAGLVNVLQPDHRYPELSIDQITRLDPSLVLLSSEPFPFSQNHVDEIQGILPKAKVIVVDGEFFSWYGSRLRLAPAYFNSLNFSGS